MEKNRQIKMMFIVALVLSVTAMTLGFAAFSTTLSISSSASVTPNSDDFHMTISGYKMSCSPTKGLANCLNGGEVSYPTNSMGEATPAKINNSTGVISDLSFTLTDFLYDTNLSNTTYLFLLKNDGKYNIFLNPDDFGVSNNVFKTCTPVGDTSVYLVEQACNNIQMTLSLHDVAGTALANRDSFMIEPGKNAVVKIEFTYNHHNNSIPDGPFEVKFDDVKLVYSTQEQ